MRDGNAKERALVTAPEGHLGGARVLEGAVGGQGDEGMQDGVELLDALEQGAGDLDGRDLALAIAGAQLTDGRIGDVVTHGCPPPLPA